MSKQASVARKRANFGLFDSKQSASLFTEAQLIHKVMFVSGVQHRDLVVHMYLYSFQSLFLCRLLQTVEYSALCMQSVLVGYPNPFSPIIPPPPLRSGNHKFVFYKAQTKIRFSHKRRCTVPAFPPSSGLTASSCFRYQHEYDAPLHSVYSQKALCSQVHNDGQFREKTMQCRNEKKS